MAHFKSNKGFTLIEMLIAMAIFISFTGVLIGSYTSIVTAQRDANEYRIMYSEARKVFETLILELRDSVVYYERVGGFYEDAGVDGERSFFFIAKDGNKISQVIYDTGLGQVSVKYSHLQDVTKLDNSLTVTFTDKNTAVLNDPKLVKITNFRIYVTPQFNPHDPKNVENDGVQFQPKVTIYANFKRTFANEKSYEMDLQTSVSSRVYNQIIPNTDNKKEE